MFFPTCYLWDLWFLIFSEVLTLFSHPCVKMVESFVWVSAFVPHPFSEQWDSPDALEGIAPAGFRRACDSLLLTVPLLLFSAKLLIVQGKMQDSLEERMQSANKAWWRNVKICRCKDVQCRVKCWRMVDPVYSVFCFGSENWCWSQAIMEWIWDGRRIFWGGSPGWKNGGRDSTRVLYENGEICLNACGERWARCAQKKMLCVRLWNMSSPWELQHGGGTQKQRTWNWVSTITHDGNTNGEGEGGGREGGTTGERVELENDVSVWKTERISRPSRLMTMWHSRLPIDRQLVKRSRRMKWRRNQWSWDNSIRGFRYGQKEPRLKCAAKTRSWINVSFATTQWVKISGNKLEVFKKTLHSWADKQRRRVIWAAMPPSL